MTIAPNWGSRCEGIPVLGTIDQLPELVINYPVDEILIAVPSASSRQMQRYVEVCERTAVKFRTVPVLRDVIAQRVSISDFREVNVDDLLGRDPVEIDLQSVRSAIRGQLVLVTGAAGSIGSEICRQLLEHEPAVLVRVDQNEMGMSYLEHELAPRRGKTALQCHVADAGSRKSMERVFQQSRPEAIFHAAAYKHVPLMEENVSAAVQNNVFGLMNLLEVASENECRRFVLISSDKAVNPCNVMGATKRIGELIVSHQPTNGMRCLSVRFGNVLGSNGSVIPMLQQQLRKNQPLTVTHPDVKRFFMTIREAVSLVLQASVIGEKGDTLVLDMGKPLLILDLVRTLIKLSGRSEKQVPIQFTGLRPGEKLFEELFYEDEEVDQTSFPKLKKRAEVYETGMRSWVSWKNSKPHCRSMGRTAARTLFAPKSRRFSPNTATRRTGSWKSTRKTRNGRPHSAVASPDILVPILPEIRLSRQIEPPSFSRSATAGSTPTQLLRE